MTPPRMDQEARARLVKELRAADHTICGHELAPLDAAHLIEADGERIASLEAAGHFEIGDECALFLKPSSRRGFDTLTILDGDVKLKIRLTKEARESLADILGKESSDGNS